MSKKTRARVGEALRFHRLCHPGDGALEAFACSACLFDIPFTPEDVRLLKQVRNGPCPTCAIAKKVRRAARPKRRGKAKPPVPPASEDLPASVQVGPTHGVLGFDHYFFEGHRFLLCVEKNTGFMLVAYLANGTKEVVGKAMEDMVDYFTRNRLRVLEAHNLAEGRSPSEGAEDAQMFSELGISHVTSDSERAIISSGLERLTRRGIDTRPVASGRHVGWVERPIRTIKERVVAVLLQLSFKATEVMVVYLQRHVVMWLNMTPKAGQQWCAYTRLARQRLSYRELTRAEFGAAVVVPRKGSAENRNSANSEQGMLLGADLQKPGSYHFLSFESGIVKSRSDFDCVSTLDLVAKFGPNPHSCLHTTFDSMVSENSDAAFSFYLPRTIGSGGEYSPQETRPPVGSREEYDLRQRDTRAAVPLEAPATPYSALPGTPSVSSGITQTPRAGPQSGPAEGWGPSLPAGTQALNINLFHEQPSSVGLAGVKSPSYAATVPTQPEPVVPAPLPAAPEKSTRPVRDVKVKPGHWTKVLRPAVAKREANAAVERMKQSGLVKDVSVAAMGFKRGIEYYKEKDRGREAVLKEVRQLMDYNVCHPVKRAYTSVNYMRTHGMLHEKMDGTLKGRYVCGKHTNPQGGAEINWGIDLFAPTIDMKLVILILSLGLQMDRRLEVWDVTGAFLKAEVTVPGLYARIDPFVAGLMCEINPKWREFLQPDGGLLVELDRAWYGIAAGPALWHRKVKATLLRAGYTQHPLVECLFYRMMPDKMYALIMLHVDDLGVLMPSDGSERDRVRHLMELEYGGMKVQRGVSVSYIGFEVTYSETSHSFELRMAKRIRNLAAKFGVTKIRKHPCHMGTILGPDDSPPFRDVTRYRSLLGGLQYLSSTVVPDAKWLVSYLSSFANAPTQKRYSELEWLMGFLLGVQDRPMSVTACGVNPIVRVYADAAFPIHEDGGSHGGLTVFFGSCLCSVFWGSGKIPVQCRHSTDAEIWQLEDATYTGDYFKRVLEVLGLFVRVIYMEDNDACTALVETGTRAHDKKRKWCVNCINSVNAYLSDEDSRASVQPVISLLQHADGMSKPLCGKVFNYHADICYGLRPPTPREKIVVNNPREVSDA